MSRLAYTCSVGGKDIESKVDSSAHRNDGIDASDLASVYDSARAAAGAPRSTPVTCSRVVREKPRQDEDLEWISRRMTPSCAKTGYDLRSVVSYDSFSCKYVGTGTVIKDGKPVEVKAHPDRTWSGRIASCTGLGEGGSGLGIPDSTMAAVQRMAYWLADGDNAGLDEKQFVCRVESLPHI